MKRLIDKSVLVSKINTFKKDAYRTWKWDTFHTLNELLSFIDTLEVKEVDLEKEIDKFYGMYRKNGITFSIEDNQEFLDWKVDCNPNFVKAFAKHFFELGMQQSKKNDNNNEEKK